ncbi:hypothetical protein CDAR_285941 [Caerostris darwini]|uniref:Uncharacterized protein n=1 Tax=Caerostris darwini TaxID=1538125 RepID=A0AAV4VZA8_9ARAC|nr:hypothetical protein CDAR_285941 [Caerostris darwini]
MEEAQFVRNGQANMPHGAFEQQKIRSRSDKCPCTMKSNDIVWFHSDSRYSLAFDAILDLMIPCRDSLPYTLADAQ